MKKIAIVTRKMITGGVERALIAMLRKADPAEAEIDLYLEELGGALFQEIPSWINCYQIPTVHSLRDALTHPVYAVKKILAMTKSRTKKYNYIQQCYLSSQMLMPINKCYDIAISYHAPNTIPVFYTIDGIRAEKKVLWLHGDLDTNAGATDLAKQYHAQYDKVYAVCRSVLESFLKYHPDKSSCAEIFYNYVDQADIREKALHGPTYQDHFDGIRILTIGRLDHQKGIDLAIDACKLLIDQGLNIRWYVCGEGNQRRELENRIAEYQLSNHFILMGNQSNPYRFLMDCDLYVQTSRSEGFCTTTNEARILGKPVITTAVSGADEQFEHGINGWIVPVSCKNIALQIIYCIEHPDSVAQVCYILMHRLKQ